MAEQQPPGVMPASFLDDLDALSDEEEEDYAAAAGGVGDADDMDEREDGGDAAMLRAVAAPAAQRSLGSLATLLRSPKFGAFAAKLGAAEDESKRAAAATAAGAAPPPLDSDAPLYALIAQCNDMLADVDAEVLTVHGLLTSLYAPKFGELESLVTDPLDYARTVKAIGNETDLTDLDFSAILPSSTAMVLVVTATTTAGERLSEEQLAKTMAAADELLALGEQRKRIVDFISDNLCRIAPNLTALVGSAVASNLIAAAGSLHALARMPAGNLQTLGNARSKQRGASGGRMQGQYLSTNATAGSNPHVGFIFHSDFVQGVPPSLRTRAFRVLSGKATLMARVDASRSSPLGEAGRDMLAQLQAKGDKWQEAAPARVAKALPAPIEKTAKKRGGKRLRARKENYATTEMAKAQNRLAFGKQEQEVIDGDEMVGLGMLGTEGNKRLRVTAKASKLGAKLEKRKQMGKYKGPTFAPGGSGTATHGLSSIAFTPVQGIELANPNQLPGMRSAKAGDESGYFSEIGGFSRVGAGGSGGTGIVLPPGGMRPPPPKKKG